MGDKRNYVSVLAVCISVIALFFSFFQWWNGRTESRISVAVEISRLYLQDNEVAKRYAIFVDFDSTRTKNTEVSLRERSYVDFLDYVSSLGNRGLIDNRYLSGRIKCDIAYVAKIVREKRPDLSRAVKEINLYVEAKRDEGCPDYPPN